MDSVQDWLFDPAAWAPAAVVVLGFAVVIFGLNRGLNQAKIAGLLVAIVGAGWYLVAASVQTWTEQAEAHAEAVVDAYDAADWRALDALIDDRTNFYDLAGDNLVRAAEATHDSIGHESLDLKGLTATRDPVGIRVRFNVTSNQSNGPARLTTAWQFDYNLIGGTLLLGTITPMDTPIVNADTVRERVVRN